MEKLRNYINSNELITQAALAKVANVDKSKLNRFLKGKGKLSIDEVNALSKVLRPFGYDNGEQTATPTKEETKPTPQKNPIKQEKEGGVDMNNLIRRTPEEVKAEKERQNSGFPSYWIGGRSGTLDRRIAEAEARKAGKDISKRPDAEKLKKAQEVLSKS